MCKECLNKKRKSEYVSVYNRPPSALATREARILYKRKWNRENKDKVKGYRLKAKYSLLYSDYEKQSLLQNNCCLCCNRQVDTLYVDHDHITGKIRGLICHKCNIGIGLLGDTLDSVLNAVAYLSKTDEEDQEDE